MLRRRPRPPRRGADRGVSCPPTPRSGRLPPAALVLVLVDVVVIVIAPPRPHPSEPASATSRTPEAGCLTSHTPTARSALGGVGDLADELLEDVLEEDHPHDRAVLRDDAREVRAGVLHGLQDGLDLVAPTHIRHAPHPLRRHRL